MELWLFRSAVTLVTRKAPTVCSVLAILPAAVDAAVVRLRPSGYRLVQPHVIAPAHDLQVFDSVVRLDAVDVMNVFIVAEQSSETLFHDESVFTNVSPRESSTGVIGSVDHDVPTMHRSATAPSPVAISRLGFGATRAGTESAITDADVASQWHEHPTAGFTWAFGLVGILIGHRSQSLRCLPGVSLAPPGVFMSKGARHPNSAPQGLTANRDFVGHSTDATVTNRRGTVVIRPQARRVAFPRPQANFIMIGGAI